MIDSDTKFCRVEPETDASDGKVPTNVTTWEWLFESEEFVPFRKSSGGTIGAYHNAVTKERLDFAQVKAKATTLSTVLVEKYGLQAGQTVSIFSTNTVWYAVALWATIRVGGLAQKYTDGMRER